MMKPLKVDIVAIASTGHHWYITIGNVTILSTRCYSSIKGTKIGVWRWVDTHLYGWVPENIDTCSLEYRIR